MAPLQKTQVIELQFKKVQDRNLDPKQEYGQGN